MDEKIIRWHIYFDGRVQGVGFRFTAQIFASQLQLTGWVRNLDDGRVEAEAQGTEENLNTFLMKLRSQPPIRITDYEIQEIPLKEGEKRFSVAPSF